MCRNKKMQIVLLGLTATLSFAGCSDKLVTDTGSGKQQEIAAEDYLETELPNQEEQTVEKRYQVHTLQVGTFEEKAVSQKSKRSYINVPTVRADLEGLEGEFGEYIATSGQYIEEGQVIATVHTEVDEITIEEARLKLQRLEERYQAASIQVEEDLEDLIEQKYMIYNDFKRAIMDIRYAQRQLDFEYEKYDYENRIEKAKEEISKLTEIGEIHEITATASGYVEYNSKYSAGDEVEDGDYICHILQDGEVYVTTDAQEDQFCYGMDVTFMDGNSPVSAEVVNGGNWALYGNLDSEEVIFKLALEQDTEQIGMSDFNNLTLNGSLKTVENVVLVPAKYVTIQEGEYFVTVMKEDGTFLKTEFIPGGRSSEYFWVLEGLTEGMQIIYH